MYRMYKPIGLGTEDWGMRENNTQSSALLGLASAG
jgi:hypothetical protein